jgi:hypothetical protein
VTWVTNLLSEDNPLSSRRFQSILAVLVSLGLCIYDVLTNKGLTGYSTGLLGALSGVAVTAVALAKSKVPATTDEGS